MELAVTTGATSRPKFQSNRHHQQTNTQLFTGRMPFLSSNQQCQSTEGKNWTKLPCHFLTNTVLAVAAELYYTILYYTILYYNITEHNISFIKTDKRHPVKVERMILWYGRMKTWNTKCTTQQSKTKQNVSIAIALNFTRSWIWKRIPVWNLEWIWGTQWSQWGGKVAKLSSATAPSEIFYVLHVIIRRKYYILG